jgi:Domain of unknown function (DUF4333)
MSWLCRSGALVALALAVVLLVACGETQVDADATEGLVEDSVQKSLQTQPSSVECPSGVKVEPGAKFSCTVRLPGGKTVIATLRIRDEDANLALVYLGSSK